MTPNLSVVEHARRATPHSVLATRSCPPRPTHSSLVSGTPMLTPPFAIFPVVGAAALAPGFAGRTGGLVIFTVVFFSMQTRKIFPSWPVRVQYCAEEHVRVSVFLVSPPAEFGESQRGVTQGQKIGGSNFDLIRSTAADYWTELREPMPTPSNPV